MKRAVQMFSVLFFNLVWPEKKSEWSHILRVSFIDGSILSQQNKVIFYAYSQTSSIAPPRLAYK